MKYMTPISAKYTNVTETLAALKRGLRNTRDVEHRVRRCGAPRR